jgi:mono/diheme cytochrome c family protein
MKRSAAFFLVLLFFSRSAASQPALNETQLLGMRLFNHSCRVCHTKPQMTSPQYAPVLSRVSLGGNDGALHAFIAKGSAKMPGFRYHFNPGEIDALVAYIKTLAPAD